MSPSRWSYDAVQRLHGSGLGLDCAVCGGGAIGVPSLALVLDKLVGGYSGSLGKLTFHSARERATPRELNPCITTLTRQLQCLPHTGRYAGASDRGGVGSTGRLRSFRAKFFACLRWGIRDAATACARDGELQWPQQPSVFVQNPAAEADQCGLFPLVRWSPCAWLPSRLSRWCGEVRACVAGHE
ncbi:hypothetical protein TcCL_NonESM11246 [Trypanosoma cruzi]|nr:hypothetical protein TcCL_NonESM11246 [Trypanosoma cruzi]